jgi:hypothetical protein
MNNLDSAMVAMDAAFKSLGINRKMLRRFIEDGIEHQRTYLQMSNGVATFEQQAKTERKIIAARAMLSLLRSYDFFNKR